MGGQASPRPPEQPHTYPADVARARPEGLRTELPHWLANPVTPREAVARMFKDAESERRAACVYLGGKTYTPSSRMTPARRRATLNAQFRRLSGGWNDAGKGLDL